MFKGLRRPEKNFRGPVESRSLELVRNRGLFVYLCKCSLQDFFGCYVMEIVRVQDPLFKREGPGWRKLILVQYLQVKMVSYYVTCFGSSRPT